MESTENNCKNCFIACIHCPRPYNCAVDSKEVDAPAFYPKLRKWCNYPLYLICYSDECQKIYGEKLLPICWDATKEWSLTIGLLLAIIILMILCFVVSLPFLLIFIILFLVICIICCVCSICGIRIK